MNPSVLSHRLLTLAAAGTLLSGCPEEPAQPPDPDEEIPAVSCEDDGAPLSIVRLAADSQMALPPWIEVCALCPPTAVELTAGSGQGPLPLAAAWSPDRTCVTAVAELPLPDDDTVDVDVRIIDGERSGDATIELGLPGGRGSNPADLGTSTWRVSLDFDDLRSPALDLAALGVDDPPRDLLLNLAPAGPAGLFEVTVGVSVPGGGDQDPCVPTSTWADEATLDRRQLGGVLSPGDVLPAPVGGPLRRGAWQARMSSTASALQSGVFLALLDVNLLEEQTGLPPDLLCEQYAAASESGVACTSCEDPGAGDFGLPTCIPLVWEFALAPAASSPLVRVDADSIPPECGSEG